MKLIISIRGGCVTGVYCDDKKVDLTIYDFDDNGELSESEKAKMEKDFERDVANLVDVL